MTSTPDELVAATRELALAALHEITPASTVGPAAGHTVEESGAVSLRFENRLAGYPGWYWTVTVAQVDDAEPTVLEVELMPGESALLAPEWVPWAERLAEYRAHQAELAEKAAADEADAEGDDSDDADADESDADDEHEADDDHDVADLLHAGDMDGVDIDELDESDEDDESDDDDVELDEEEDESDDSDDEPEDDESE